jgi:hypothetical protein
VTNLGRAGTIARQGEAYLLAPTEEGEETPKLDGRQVMPDGMLLKSGDIIEVAGTRLQFYFEQR